MSSSLLTVIVAPVLHRSGFFVYTALLLFLPAFICTASLLQSKHWKEDETRTKWFHSIENKARFTIVSMALASFNF